MSDPVFAISQDLIPPKKVEGRIVVMERGGVSFVDKVRWAEAAGAVGCVVIQSPTGVWPFSMSDTQQVGNDVTLPSLMVSHLDGVGLRAALEAAAAKGELRPRGHAIARDHRTTCAVCLQEMIASTMAVRLPCGHSFHEECAREWLRNVTPPPPPSQKYVKKEECAREWLGSVTSSRPCTSLPPSFSLSLSRLADDET